MGSGGNLGGCAGGWGKRGVVGDILVKFDGEITAIGADELDGEITTMGVDKFDGENAEVGADKFDGGPPKIGSDKFNGGITGIGTVDFCGGISTTSTIGKLTLDTDVETLVATAIMHAVRIKNKIIFTQVCETV